MGDMLVDDVRGFQIGIRKEKGMYVATDIDGVEVKEVKAWFEGSLERSSTKRRVLKNNDMVGILSDGGKQIIIHPGLFGARVRHGDHLKGRMIPFAEFQNNEQGCRTFTKDVCGKILVLKRGGCDFYTKALNAQNSQARSIIVIDETSDQIVSMTGYDRPFSVDLIEIPVFYATNDFAKVFHIKSDVKVDIALKHLVFPLNRVDQLLSYSNLSIDNVFFFNSYEKKHKQDLVYRHDYRERNYLYGAYCITNQCVNV
jgi:hypothetical protein